LRSSSYPFSQQLSDILLRTMELINKMEPASRFLCIFSVRFGTQTILLYSLVQAIFTLCMSASSVIMNTPTYGYATSSGSQLFAAFWSLAGLPLILFGIWGCQARNGNVLRLFLYYLAASFLVDVYYSVNVFLIKDSCKHLEEANTVRRDFLGERPSVTKEGRAFACGVAQGTSYLFFTLLLVLMAYCIYIVWSHVKELTEGGSGTAIAKLMTWDGREEREWNQLQHNYKGRYDGAAAGIYDHSFRDA